MSFSSYVLALMVWLSPLQQGVDASQHLPEARETVAQRQQRYEEISEDLVAVVQKELCQSSVSQQEQMMARVLAITHHESGWHRHVDLGVGPRARGDNGGSWCLAQINVGAGVTFHGWSGEDLVEDRRKCLTAAVRIVRLSFGVCRNLPLEHRLSAYASGRCDRGRAVSARMMRTASRLLSRWRQLKTSKGPVLLPAGGIAGTPPSPAGRLSTAGSRPGG